MYATIAYICYTRNFVVSFTSWNMAQKKVQGLITIYIENDLNMGNKISIFKSNLEWTVYKKAISIMNKIKIDLRTARTNYLLITPSKTSLYQ